MSFQQEMKEFITGFQAGRKVVEDRLDRAERAENRAENKRRWELDFTETKRKYDETTAIGQGYQTDEERRTAIGKGVTNEALQTRGKEFMAHLESLGYSKEAAAGIVGNLIAESNLSTDAKGDRTKDGTPTAFGIAQWRHDRVTRLHEFAKRTNSDVNDWKTQLNFIDWEMKNTHKQAGQALAGAKSAQQAADMFALHFERPHGATSGDPNQIHNIGGRRAYAGSLFQAYTGAPGASKPAPQSQAAAGTAAPAVTSTRDIDPSKPTETVKPGSPAPAGVGTVTVPGSGQVVPVTGKPPERISSAIPKPGEVPDIQIAEMEIDPDNPLAPVRTLAAGGPVEKFLMGGWSGTSTGETMEQMAARNNAADPTGSAGQAALAKSQADAAAAHQAKMGQTPSAVPGGSAGIRMAGQQPAAAAAPAAAPATAIPAVGGGNGWTARRVGDPQRASTTSRDPMAGGAQEKFRKFQADWKAGKDAEAAAAAAKAAQPAAAEPVPYNSQQTELQQMPGGGFGYGPARPRSQGGTAEGEEAEMAWANWFNNNQQSMHGGNMARGGAVDDIPRYAKGGAVEKKREYDPMTDVHREGRGFEDRMDVTSYFRERKEEPKKQEAKKTALPPPRKSKKAEPKQKPYERRHTPEREIPIYSDPDLPPPALPGPLWPELGRGPTGPASHPAETQESQRPPAKYSPPDPRRVRSNPPPAPPVQPLTMSGDDNLFGDFNPFAQTQMAGVFDEEISRFELMDQARQSQGQVPQQGPPQVAMAGQGGIPVPGYASGGAVEHDQQDWDRRHKEAARYDPMGAVSVDRDSQFGMGATAHLRNPEPQHPEQQAAVQRIAQRAKQYRKAPPKQAPPVTTPTPAPPSPDQPKDHQPDQPTGAIPTPQIMPEPPRVAEPPPESPPAAGPGTSQVPPRFAPQTDEGIPRRPGSESQAVPLPIPRSSAGEPVPGGASPPRPPAVTPAQPGSPTPPTAEPAPPPVNPPVVPTDQLPPPSRALPAPGEGTNAQVAQADIPAADSAEAVGQTGAVTVLPQDNQKVAQVMLTTINGLVGGDPKRLDKLVPQDKVVQAGVQASDPEGKLGLEDRNMKFMHDMFDFYMARGNPGKAAEMVAGIGMYNRKKSMQAGLLAQAAIEGGNLEAGLKLLQRAYAYIPDGTSLEYNVLDNGQIQYTLFDSQTGNRSAPAVVNPQVIHALSQKVASGQAWFGMMNQISQGGGKGRGGRGGSDISGPGVEQAGAPAKQSKDERLAAEEEQQWKDKEDQYRQQLANAKTDQEKIAAAALLKYLPQDRGYAENQAKSRANITEEGQIKLDALTSRSGPMIRQIADEILRGNPNMSVESGIRLAERLTQDDLFQKKQVNTTGKQWRIPDYPPFFLTFDAMRRAGEVALKRKETDKPIPGVDTVK